MHFARKPKSQAGNEKEKSMATKKKAAKKGYGRRPGTAGGKKAAKKK